MENNKEKVLDDFLNDNEEINLDEKDNKNIILNEREGLIERIDRQFITSDGRQLLREQY